MPYNNYNHKLNCSTHHLKIYVSHKVKMPNEVEVCRTVQGKTYLESTVKQLDFSECEFGAVQVSG